jgi:hypothetical protein
MDNVILGVTHLLLNGQIVPLLKCPFCSFRNIHEDEITHHIKYKDDAKHDVDLDKLDKSTYLVTKKESRYKYESKDDLPLPSIKCLWCKYEDKVERDLEWHILEQHKKRLYQMKATLKERHHDPVWTRDPFSWIYTDVEYRLYKAVRLAKRKSGIVTGGQ